MNSKCHQSLNKYEIDLFVQIIFKKQKSTEAAIRIKVKFPQMELKRSISEVTIMHYTNLYTIIYYPLHSVMFFLGKSFIFFIIFHFRQKCLPNYYMSMLQNSSCNVFHAITASFPAQG